MVPDLDRHTHPYHDQSHLFREHHELRVRDDHVPGLHRDGGRLSCLVNETARHASSCIPEIVHALLREPYHCRVTIHGLLHCGNGSVEIAAAWIAAFAPAFP